MDIKHSGFKSLTTFLKASAKEGLVKIKETKGGVVVIGTNHLQLSKDGLINEDFDIGVDGSHSSVQAHIHHAIVKDAETRKETQEVQTRGVGKVEQQHRERQVTFLRKPGPIGAAFFQHISKE